MRSLYNKDHLLNDESIVRSLHSSKDHLFRDESIERQKTVAPAANIGRLFKTTRVIDMIGYYYMHAEFLNTDQYKEACVDIMTRQRAFPAIEMFVAPDMLDQFREAEKNQTREFIKRWGVSRAVQKQALDRCLIKAYTDENKRMERGLWFRDFLTTPWNGDDPKLLIGTGYITGIKRCWTGSYCAPSHGYTNSPAYGEDYDSAPGGLSDAHFHNLYTAKVVNPLHYHCEDQWKSPTLKQWIDDHCYTTLVHPGDIEFIEVTSDQRK